MKKTVSLLLAYLLLMVASVFPVSAEMKPFAVSAYETSILEFENYTDCFPIKFYKGRDANPDNLASGGDYVYNASYTIDYVDVTIPISVEKGSYYDAEYYIYKGNWLSVAEVFLDGAETPLFTTTNASPTMLETGDDIYYHADPKRGKDFPAAKYGLLFYLTEGTHHLTFRFLAREKYGNTVAFAVDCLKLIPADSATLPETLYLSMSGETKDTNAKGATVMMVKEGANIDTLQPTDVLHLDQTDIAEDGSYNLVLPFFTNGSYELHSNMSGFGTAKFDKEIIYVSEFGSDENDGSRDAPYRTLAKAYESVSRIKHIFISGNVAYTDAPNSYGSTLTINGTSDASLHLPETVSLNGALTLKNLHLVGTSKIYANGKRFIVEETVTSANRLTVLGGKYNQPLTGDTHITLLGGSYSRIYGGGEGVVNGNTYVILGGNANLGDSIDSKASNVSPCYVFGGGNGHAVTGATNVTLSGNAVTNRIYGSGAAAGASATNIIVEGGKACTIFGGTYGAPIDSCETNITITGGLVESLFGGSESQPMTNSHTRIYLLGGEVSRRVYSGCYNNTDETACTVQGSSAIVFEHTAAVNTKTELHADNQTDMGIYAGSRLTADSADEKNMIIFRNNCFDTFKDAFGPLDDANTQAGIKSRPHYLVYAGDHGTVSPSKAAGAIRLSPEKGYAAKINGKFVTAEIYAVSQDTTVLFEKSYSIDSVIASPTDTGAEADVKIIINSSDKTITPWIIVAIYDDHNTLVDCQTLDIMNASFSAYFAFDYDLEAGRPYRLKAMLWNGNMQPLTAEYQVQLQK